MQAHQLTRMLAMRDEKPESTGRAKGGDARAAKLSPERRSEIAKRAAIARHGLKATHKGNFKEEFGVDVECYVLNDVSKTAVISQRGMGEVLGLGEGGSRLPAFIKGQRIAPHVGHELAEKLEKPIVFQGVTAGTNALATVYGYDVTTLIDVCSAIIEAEAAGALQPRQMRFARQAHIITGASAKSGIKGLVYALAGYSPSTQEVIAAFKLYVKEEAKKYEQEFPPELYAAWHRLYQIPAMARGRPWLFKELTLRHVYIPLAKSQGKILELLRDAKSQDEAGRRRKLFQFLSDIGTRALRLHLGRITEMAESSPIKFEYESKVAERFGGQLQYELPLFIPTDPPAEIS